MEPSDLWHLYSGSSISLDDGAQATFSWWEWHWHSDLHGGLLLFTAAYLLCVGPLRGFLVQPDIIKPTKLQITSFLAGVLTMVFALSGPIHELADNYLFSAHMAQHILITLVVPPLLLLGTPDWLLRPLTRISVVMRLGRFFTLPLVAFLLFNSVFSIWHFPLFYDGALRQHAFHILEHLLFLATAVIVWWPVLSPLPELPRIPYPTQVLYLVLLSISQTPLFAVITFSNDVIYSFYETAPRIWDISPLTDQQLGGIIMKVSWIAVFLPAICIIFLKWFYHEETEDRHEFETTV